MSEWAFPILSPPEYLDRKILTVPETDWKYYSTELGLKNNLKPFTTETDTSKKVTFTVVEKISSSPSTDPPLAYSEPWSNCDFVKSNKKRRWTKCRSNFKECIKSVKCRFTILGIFLGLLLSLGAIIPITVLWRISNSTNIASSSANRGAYSSLSASTSVITNTMYFGDQQVIFTTNMITISLLLTVRVQRIDNTTYHGTYNSFNSIINSTYTITNSEIIYIFFIQGAQLLPAGNYSCNVQFQLPNVNHVTSEDTYSIETTSLCGTINIASGNFS